MHSLHYACGPWVLYHGELIGRLRDPLHCPDGHHFTFAETKPPRVSHNIGDLNENGYFVNRYTLQRLGYTLFFTREERVMKWLMTNASIFTPLSQCLMHPEVVVKDKYGLVSGRWHNIVSLFGLSLKQIMRLIHFYEYTTGNRAAELPE